MAPSIFRSSSRRCGGGRSRGRSRGGSRGRGWGWRRTRLRAGPAGSGSVGGSGLGGCQRAAHRAIRAVWSPVAARVHAGAGGGERDRRDPRAPARHRCPGTARANPRQTVAIAQKFVNDPRIVHGDRRLFVRRLDGRLADLPARQAGAVRLHQQPPGLHQGRRLHVDERARSGGGHAQSRGLRGSRSSA